MPEIVEAVKPSQWQTDGGEQRTTYRITLVGDVGQREVPCYDARGADLKTDTELPAGWEVKTSKAGKLYLAAPKAAGGGGWGGGSGKSSWYNSEEGVRFTQERTDRRTALMQAASFFDSKVEHSTDQVTGVANIFYAWLRKDVSAPRAVAGGKSETVAAPARAASGEAVEPGQVGADTPSNGGGGIEYPQVGSGKPPSASATPPPSSPTHAEKWSPYGNPEKCAHQLVPGIKGWLKCTRCGVAKKEGEWT